MLRRLLGLETEYAIRYAPAQGHPGNDALFRAIARAVSRLVPTRPGASAHGREQFFTSNGGAFYYEFLPQCQEGGLLEGATPECRGPAEALLYQRAQERLLLRALRGARKTLASRGFEGEIGLLKNSRDAFGHVYGGQENYEVEIASGLGLALYRLGLILLLPVLALTAAVAYVTVALVLVATAVGVLGALAVPRWRRRLLELTGQDERRIENALGRFHLWLIVVLTWPVAVPFALLLRLVAFRRVRRDLLALLVTRPVLAGSGSVEGRRFFLSEKGRAIRRLTRLTILPGDRPIFDTGNLVKMMCAPFNFQLAPVFHLFRRRQRLQLGVADSNRAQVAEYLKIGTAALVLDMIEDGFLDPAPRLRRPLAALAAVLGDTTLSEPLELTGGRRLTVLEVQRLYLDAARRYVRESPATSLEARELVRLWGEALDALSDGDHGALVGRLDWVTKRFLCERCGDGEEAALKTLDLRYHELGAGYFDRLERAGETVELVSPESVERAIDEPPADTPAFLRGRLIRRRAALDLPLTVTWHAAHLGSRLGGRVVPFRR